MKFWYVFFVILTYTGSTYSFFWSKKKVETQQNILDQIKQLEKQQVDAPTDPYINYNLGVAQYKVGRYNDAHHCFGRTLDHAQKDVAVIKLAYFNKANALYQDTLHMLGKDWKQQKDNEQTLYAAKKQLEDALAAYQGYTVLGDEDGRAVKNKKIVQTLLDEVIKQLQKQQKDQSKDQKDQQKKQDKKDQQQGDKNQEQDQQGNQSKDNQDQSNEKPDQQNDNNKQQQKNKSGKNQQDQEQQQDGDQDKQQQDDQKKSQQQNQPGNDGKDQENQSKQGGDQEQKNQAGQSDHEKQEQGVEQPQSAQAGKPDEKKSGNDKEQRRARAFLDNLDQMDKDAQDALQKKMIGKGGGHGKKTW